MDAVRIAGSGGTHLAVYEGGNPDGPPILLIHGTSQNHLVWERQLAAPLADEFRLISFDLRGHGASDKPLDPESYSSAEVWAGDLAAVIEGKGLERPVLVGWSYGGFIIADYLRQLDEHGVGGVVFIGTPPCFGTEEALSFVSEELLGIFEGVVSPDVRSCLHATRALIRLAVHPLDGEGAGAETVQMAYGSAMMVAPQIRLAMWSRAIDNHDVLAKIRVPTLVVQGGDDRVIRVGSGQRVAEIVPGSTLLVYERSGHAPFLDDPERFNRDLGEFVRSARG